MKNIIFRLVTIFNLTFSIVLLTPSFFDPLGFRKEREAKNACFLHHYGVVSHRESFYALKYNHWQKEMWQPFVTTNVTRTAKQHKLFLHASQWIFVLYRWWQVQFCFRKKTLKSIRSNFLTRFLVLCFYAAVSIGLEQREFWEFRPLRHTVVKYIDKKRGTKNACGPERDLAFFVLRQSKKCLTHLELLRELDEGGASIYLQLPPSKKCILGQYSMHTTFFAHGGPAVT